MNNNKRLIIMSVTGVLILICGVVGITYSWFSTVVEGTGKPIIVSAGVLDVKYDEAEVMNVSFGKPIYDDNRATQAYKNTFTISHEGRSTIDACYSIDLSIDSIQDKFKSKWVKYELYDVTNDVSVTGVKDFSNVVSTGTIELAEALKLNVGESVQYEFRVWLSYSDIEDQTELLQNNSGTAISAHIKVSAKSGECVATPDYYLYEQILLDNPNIETRTDFNVAFTTSNNGNTIYKASGQDGKDTYYFAGQVTNNYVKFGTNSDGDELWWRIVRINEDNSVRLIYAGTSTEDTSAFINTGQAYNSSYNNSAYVGYMYTANEQFGTSTNSSIKTVLDNWYINNLSGFDEYISKTAIYCNDRTVGSGTWSATGSTFYYAAYSRLVDGKSPTYICGNVNDRFTASTSTGNGKLTYPIGLITADEVAYAGGKNGTNNSSYYIAQNAKTGATYWWTMSPSSWENNLGNHSAGVFSVGGSAATGNLNYNNVNTTYGVRPVISLKSCVQYNSGDGTAGNPYTVELSDTCSTAEN